MEHLKGVEGITLNNAWAACIAADENEAVDYRNLLDKIIDTHHSVQQHAICMRQLYRFFYGIDAQPISEKIAWVSEDEKNYVIYNLDFFINVAMKWITLIYTQKMVLITPLSIVAQKNDRSVSLHMEEKECIWMLEPSCSIGGIKNDDSRYIDSYEAIQKACADWGLMVKME